MTMGSRASTTTRWSGYAALVIALALLAACGSSSTSSAAGSPAVSAAASAARVPVSVTGQGDSDSSQFHLDKGAYKVDWTCDTVKGQFQAQVLTVTKPGQGTTVADVVIDGRAQASGQSTYESTGSDFKLRVSTNGAPFTWTVIFTPS